MGVDVYLGNLNVCILQKKNVIELSHDGLKTFENPFYLIAYSCTSSKALHTLLAKILEQNSEN